MNRAEILAHMKRVDKIHKETETKLKKLSETTTSGGAVNDKEIALPSATIDQYNAATDDFVRFMQQYESRNAGANGSGTMPAPSGTPGTSKVDGAK